MSITNPRQTFLNPVVPFAGTILGGLLPGEMVLIQGSVPCDADRFQIDFTCGSSVKPRADVAFHFNPRFKKSPGIVCNTMQNERWGKEQMQSQTSFKPGSAFEVFVLVQTQSFKGRRRDCDALLSMSGASTPEVAVNGAHCLEYKHRLDLDRVDTLAISGMVKIEVVGIIPSNTTTAPVPANLRTEATEPNSLLSSSGDLSLPFRGQLVKGLSVGHTITIKGKTNVSNFGVNLRVGGGTDIALHLNPRLKEAQFIRNSYLSECWGPEETDLPGTLPFKTGEYFEMIILCEAHAFKVAVNGVHQLDYKHRVQDLKKITELEAMGDVQLLGVKLL